MTWATFASVAFAIIAIKMWKEPTDIINFDISQPHFNFWAGTAAALVTALLILFMADLYRLRQEGRAQARELPGRALRIAAAFRTSRYSASISRHFSTRLIPAIFASLLLFSLFSILNSVAFSFLEAGGWICTQHGAPFKKIGAGVEFRFFINDGCNASGLFLRRGYRYRIGVTDVETTEGVAVSDWRAGAVKLSGLPVLPFHKIHRELSTGSLVKFSLLMPLRRILSEEWFTVIVRVGMSGDQQYPLSSTHKRVIEPKRDGELFVYTNSPVIGLPIVWNWFYRGNVGFAGIKLEVLSTSEGQD